MKILIKILKQIRAAFFQFLSTGLCLVLLISCGSYTHTSYRPKIKSLLAITETGDTVSVSMREFERQKYDTYTRFNYNNNWYWNNWRYDFNWGWNQWWYNQPNRYWWSNDLRYTNPSRGYSTPSRPKVKPKTRPRVTQPRPQPRPRVNPKTRQSTPRGYNPSRARTTPNVQTRTNVGRGSSGGSRGSSGGKRNQ